MGEFVGPGEIREITMAQDRANRERQMVREIDAFLDRHFPPGTTRLHNTTRPDEDVVRFQIRTGSFYTEGTIVSLGWETSFEQALGPAIVQVAQTHFFGLAHRRGGYS